MTDLSKLEDFINEVSAGELEEEEHQTLAGLNYLNGLCRAMSIISGEKLGGEGKWNQRCTKISEQIVRLGRKKESQE